MVFGVQSLYDLALNSLPQVASKSTLHWGTEEVSTHPVITELTPGAARIIMVKTGSITEQHQC